MASASARPPHIEGNPFVGYFRSRRLGFLPLRAMGTRPSGEDEVAHLVQLARLALVIALVTMMGASIVLGIMLGVLLGPPVPAHFAFWGTGLALLLASKLGYQAVAAWHIRRNHAAERPLTRAELRDSPAAAELSLPRILLAIVIAAAMVAVGAVVFSRTMDDIDVERRWIGMIGGVTLAVIGICRAYCSVDIFRRHAARRRSVSSK